MNYLRLKIYTSEFGIDKVEAMLNFKGFEKAAEADMASAETMVGKYLQTTLKDEIAIVAFAKDDEEGRKQIKDVQVTSMILKSKEMEGMWGWDVTLGRMYAEDEVVAAENWNNY